MQYPVTYVASLSLDRCNSFSHCATVVEKRKKKESQKIDDLPVLMACQSGTLAMLSSKVNGPAVHGGT